MLRIRQSTRRALSHDESLQRYFRLLERQYLRTLTRGHIAAVYRRLDNHVDEALPIDEVVDSGAGLIVYVR